MFASRIDSRARFVTGTSAVGIRKNSASPEVTLNRSASNFGSCPVPTSELRAHEVRHVDLGVAVLAGVQVEHVLDQRAVQAREAALQHDETRAGNPAGGFEIHRGVGELLADGDVIERREFELARRAPATHFDVVVFVAAVRHALVQRVRQAEHELVELGLDVRQFLVEAGHAGAEFFADGQQRRDVLALGLGLADVLGVRVAGRTHFVGGDLRGLAAILERLETLDVELEATAREVGGDGGRIGSEQAWRRAWKVSRECR